MRNSPSRKIENTMLYRRLVSAGCEPHVARNVSRWHIQADRMDFMRPKPIQGFRERKTGGYYGLTDAQWDGPAARLDTAIRLGTVNGGLSENLNPVESWIEACLFGMIPVGGNLWDVSDFESPEHAINFIYENRNDIDSIPLKIWEDYDD